MIFEDEHLLVVHKPAGWNTHAPAPYAGEGIYDWLRQREPRWAALAILHRLDKETSGILVFGKTPAANRSLTAQFTERRVQKKYRLVTDRPGPQREIEIKTALVRSGEKYLSRAPHAGAEIAQTRFRLLPEGQPAPGLPPGGENGGPCQWVEAEPLTGRTHQIRVHAAEAGFPILGDTLYGGTPAARVFLHAAEISFTHPATGKQVTFCAPVDFSPGPGLALRAALIDPQLTNGFRVVHGASDGWPGWYVDRLGDFLLSQAAFPLPVRQREELSRLARWYSIRGAYHKILSRQVRLATAAESSPQTVLGETAPGRFEICENSVRFELSFNEGYSAGLFLDQRDNRRRLLAGQVAAGFPLYDPKPPVQDLKPEVLNVFAYTCGFSVCAALAGAKTTSLDLSKKYLEWGKRNFVLNGLDPAAHDFIYGDAFDWLRRLAKKGRAFDVVVLDPPTFSQSKECGVFRVEKDLGRAIAAALPLLRGGGVLLASTNAADWPPEKFIESVNVAIHTARRKVIQSCYIPQPPDFPISRAEPAYLKTVWLRVG